MNAIEMHNITKIYSDNLIANDSINIEFQKGEIHAIVGENGAGKTTLMKILSGMTKMGSGEIFFNGVYQNISSAEKAIRLGIGMVHQNFLLVKTLTVLQNIIMGRESTKHMLIDYKSPLEKVNKLSSQLNLTISLFEKIEKLSFSDRQKIEIIKLLYRNAEYLILDEPTTLLTPGETERLFELLQQLRDDGKTIILITHKLKEVFSISNNITVLRKGKVTGTFKTGETSREEIAGLITESKIRVLEKVGNFNNKKQRFPVLEIDNLYVKNDFSGEAVKNFSLKIHGGEITGLAGVTGNGQKELIEAITNLRKIHKGSILIDNQPHTFARISYIPADTDGMGIVNDFNIYENLILGRHREKRFSNLFRFKKEEINKYTDELIKYFEIQLTNPDQMISGLSGGNKQKAVAARELSKDTSLIIADHPVKGLDIRATEFIHQLLQRERDKGKAILLISSNLEEILKISDRIVVIYNGNIIKELVPSSTNEKEIGMYMAGVN